MWVDHQFDGIPVENIYTASYLTAMYLQDKMKTLPAGSSAFVIGEQGFKDELVNFGIKVSNNETDVAENSALSAGEFF